MQPIIGIHPQLPPAGLRWPWRSLTSPAPRPCPCPQLQPLESSTNVREVATAPLQMPQRRWSSTGCSALEGTLMTCPVSALPSPLPHAMSLSCGLANLALQGTKTPTRPAASRTACELDQAPKHEHSLPTFMQHAKRIGQHRRTRCAARSSESADGMVTAS